VIKICGITRLVDALHAVKQGATALGFVFWPQSPRVVSIERARDIIRGVPAGILTVGVFVNESPDSLRRAVEESGVRAVQLHGDERPEDFRDLERPLVRSVTLADIGENSRKWPAGTTMLLDTSDRIQRGGTGQTVDWARAAMFARHHRFVLAGGLTPENVEEAIRTVRPVGVDVSSGVETSPGVKDFQKVSTFLANARRGFERLKTANL
jgi:phosphoribosylanthranilate isomerase